MESIKFPITRHIKWKAKGEKKNYFHAEKDEKKSRMHKNIKFPTHKKS